MTQFIFFVLFSTISTSFSLTSQSQILGLYYLYNSTNGTNWLWKNEAINGPRWSFGFQEQPPQTQRDPCNDQNKVWQGITCSSSPNICKVQECFILALTLDRGYDLKGTIPDEMFSQLTSFTSFQISSSPQLKGTLPASIGSLTNLVELQLTENQLTGSIPAYNWTNLTKLTLLDLNSNKITGTLSTALAHLSNLQTLSLFLNRFSGSLPSQLLTSLSQLSILHLQGNFLSGVIPTEIGVLTHLSSLAISFNQFTGTIPTELCQLTRLSSIDLDKNQLTGQISSQFSNLLQLIDLYLDNNYFTGNLPSGFGRLTKLDVFSLYYNQLTGTIPPQIGNLSSMYLGFLNHNHFSGVIPTTFGNLLQLESIYLEMNQLTGVIPLVFSSLSVLRTLSCYANRLTGTIPKDFSSLVKISRLELNNNFLSGSLPTELSTWSRLTILSLYSNEFTGMIPSQFGNLTRLVSFFASNNLLTGFIPSQFGLLQNLQFLNVSLNLLSQSIPSEITFCSEHQELDLSSNLITGTLPSSLSNLTLIRQLHLFQNRLKGQLVFPLCSLPQLEQFFVQQNHLEGNLNQLIPDSSSSSLCSSQSSLVNLDLSGNHFSGTIPDSIFHFPYLFSVSLSLNCFQHKLPSTICDRADIEVISMDGLRSAHDCKNTVDLYFTSVTFGQNLDGRIPSCVWSLSKLKVINLAGNGLEGTIGDVTKMSSLVSMTLSHNYLSGVIPLSLQTKNLTLLDLSHNKLTGDVDGFKYSHHGSDDDEDDENDDEDDEELNLFKSPSSTSSKKSRTLILSVNRLSGDLSESFAKYSTLDILSGNLFSCEYIPNKDENRERITCGSEEYDQTIIVMLSILSVTIALAVIYFSISYLTKRYSCHRRHHCFIWLQRRLLDYNQLMKYVSYYKLNNTDETENSTTASFGLLLSNIIKIVCILTSLSVILSLPVYILKNQQSDSTENEYVTHSHMYNWLWTMAFLSGSLPAIILLIMTFICLLIFSLLLNQLEKTEPLSLISSLRRPLSSINSTKSVEPNLNLTGIVWLIFLCNTAIVGTMNGLYIWSTLTEMRSDQRTLIQVGFGFFSFFWNVVILRGAMPSKIKSSRHGILLLTCLSMMNSVLIPCIVIALSSPSCYQRLLVPPDKILSSYKYDECGIFVISPTIVSCLFSVSVTMDPLRISPPFSYSYQCGSTLLISYLPVYMYSITTQIFSILSKLVFIYSSYHFSYPAWLISRFPGVYWPEQMKSTPGSGQTTTASNEIEGGGLVRSNIRLIRPHEIISATMNNMLLLLSFGLCSPLLGCYIALCICLHLYFWLFVIGRFISFHQHNTQQQQQDHGQDQLTDNDNDNKSHFSPMNLIQSDLLLKQLNEQLHDCHSLVKISRWPVFITSCFFITLLSWDMVGDKVGWDHGLWVPLIGLIIVVILWFVDKLFHSGGLCVGQSSSSSSQESSFHDSFSIEFTNSSLHQPPQSHSLVPFSGQSPLQEKENSA